MPLENDHGYWLEQAEEMRALAGTISNHKVAQEILGVAESYLRLADQVARGDEALARQSKHTAEQKERPGGGLAQIGLLCYGLQRAGRRLRVTIRELKT
jgi:hypothetical protein